MRPGSPAVYASCKTSYWLAKRSPATAGYGSHVQNDLTCAANPPVGGTIIMGYHVAPGFSGSPVLTAPNGQAPRPVGVVSATNATHSIGFMPTKTLVKTTCDRS